MNQPRHPPLPSIETKLIVNELYRHKKSGGYYRVIGVGRIEATLESVVVYKSLATHDTWIRPLAEFEEKFDFWGWR